jgi:hypothetical protein
MEMAAESGLDAMNSAETKPKERDSVSRVRENRSHGLTRGRAANAGYRLVALSTLLFDTPLFAAGKVSLIN